jgi:acyl-CoA synthetase (AMP-forming)/AMP-acid ligase II
VWIVGDERVEVGGEVVRELPKTASGKVMKHVLRDWSRALVEKGVGKVGQRDKVQSGEVR